MKTYQKILLAVVVIAALGLLARYVIFAEKFEQWGQGLERIEDWQDDYRQDNPNATDAEMDAEFSAGINDIKVWKEKYKQDNPGATDADADAAFNSAWGN